jgi:hypothetical protein
MGAIAVSSDSVRKTNLLSGRASTDNLAGGVGGLSVHDVTMLKTVKLGGIELHDVPALINRADDEEPLQGANVGMDIFRRFRVITDYPNSRLLLGVDPVAVAAPFQRDRSGLRALFAGDRLRVGLVSRGSPAAADGWKTGEEIVAIDGEAISPAFLSGPHAKWSSGRPGDIVDLTLADGSRRRLTLKDYF